MSGRIPRQQTPDIGVLLSHFLRQVESHHIQTPSRSPLALHYDSRTQSLTEYPWPCDPETMRRIPPSELEGYRRTHRLRGPSCLCAFLDRKDYTESRIGIVESMEGTRGQSSLRGEYVAVCTTQRCGYYLCLERFYPLNGLKLKICVKRVTPLAAQELTYISLIERATRVGEGLHQVMTNAMVRGRGSRLKRFHEADQHKLQLSQLERFTAGLTEGEFWETFVQCVPCRLVMLRESFVLHECCGIRAAKKRRHHPFHSTGRRIYAGPMMFPGDVPETSLSRLLMPSSPAPTEIDGTLGEGTNASTSNATGFTDTPNNNLDSIDEIDNENETDNEGETDKDDETDVIPESDQIEAPLSDGFELPSILQLLEPTRTRSPTL